VSVLLLDAKACEPDSVVAYEAPSNHFIAIEMNQLFMPKVTEKSIDTGR